MTFTNAKPFLLAMEYSWFSEYPNFSGISSLKFLDKTKKMCLILLGFKIKTTLQTPICDHRSGFQILEQCTPQVFMPFMFFFQNVFFNFSTPF